MSWKRWLVLAVVLLLGLDSVWADESSRALAALRKALDSSATWTMTRTLPGSTRTLRTTGRVDCRAGEGIRWTVRDPFDGSESTVTMATNGMTFADAEGVRVKALDELPHYEDFREATDRFQAGETNAFDRVFAIEASGVGREGWRLVFTPKIGALERLFTSLELTGTDLPTNAVLRSAQGGETRIAFERLP